jgi:hypothetical protein
VFGRAELEAAGVFRIEMVLVAVPGVGGRLVALLCGGVGLRENGEVAETFSGIAVGVGGLLGEEPGVGGKDRAVLDPFT